MVDKIEKWGTGSLIQHGPLNQRIYLMKLSDADLPEIIPSMSDMARDEGYSKIFCKIPSYAAPLFISDGYVTEAIIPKFYQAEQDLFFMSKFLDSDRLLDLEHEKLTALNEQLVEAPPKPKQILLKPGLSAHRMKAGEAQEMCELYRQVFKSYPFPIFDSEYILETMDSHIEYFGVRKKGQLIALASAETDQEMGNAEMTDFATLPGHRGLNLSVILLDIMEREMRSGGYTTLYTIARLNSVAMNRTFLKMGYRYAGTLVKNTNISGSIESMNVYYKHL